MHSLQRSIAVHIPLSKLCAEYCSQLEWGIPNTLAYAYTSDGSPPLQSPPALQLTIACAFNPIGVVRFFQYLMLNLSANADVVP